MLTAGITSLLFKIMKQPVVLGYIVAGVLVGPYVIGESWIENEDSVDTWGQIGVLFLLFAMGLEFSFKKLLQVGTTAVTAAAVIVIGMMTIGFFAGRLLGWNEINALFLGGMLSMSSTTIVFKALDDMGLSNHKFAKICFGILIVEDLFAVVLMVLLSSIATSRSFEGMELAGQVVKLLVYLVFWFVLGIVVIPTFLRKFKKWLNDETLTILSIGLCLGMVLLATNAGFSSALGAFVMGSLLAETLEAERIETLVQPVKNIFGSIFFVSVGMMINPSQLATYALPIIILTLVVIFGQIIFATAGTLLSGQSLHVSLQTSFSLVQVGEFAFIIAALGQSLEVTSKSLYPIVVAVSVITTFLTPFVMRASEPTYNWLDRHLSSGAKLTLERYAQQRNTITTHTDFQRLAQRTLTGISVYGIILFFVFLIFFKYVYPFITALMPDDSPVWMVHTLQILLLIAVMSPFVYAIASCQRHSAEERKLWRMGSREKAQLIGLWIVRLGVAIGFVAYAIIHTYSITWGLVVAFTIVVFLGLFMSRRVRKHSKALTMQFNQNLSAREKSAEAHRPVSRTFTNSLLDYDVHISDIILPAASSFCGCTLASLGIRKRCGVSIVSIVRSGIAINIPGGSAKLFPADKIVVAGSDRQIDSFKKMLDESIRNDEDKNTEIRKSAITLERFTITPESRLLNKSILESHIREQAQCIVLGIERNSSTLPNPEPSEVFAAGDVIIVVGEKKSIQHFVSAKQSD